MLVIAQRWNASERRIEWVVVAGSTIKAVCPTEITARYIASLIARTEVL